MHGSTQDDGGIMFYSMIKDILIALREIENYTWCDVEIQNIDSYIDLLLDENTPIDKAIIYFEYENFDRLKMYNGQNGDKIIIYKDHLESYSIEKDAKWDGVSNSIRVNFNDGYEDDYFIISNDKINIVGYEEAKKKHEEYLKRKEKRDKKKTEKNKA